MAIMTPENLHKNLDNALKSVIIFDEKITIATDKGNAIIISEMKYNKIVSKLTKSSIKNMKGDLAISNKLVYKLTNK